MERWHVFQKCSSGKAWGLLAAIAGLGAPATAAGAGPKSRRDRWGCAGSFLGDVFLLLKHGTQERDSFGYSSGCHHLWMSHLAQPSSSQSWTQPKPRTPERRMKIMEALTTFLSCPVTQAGLCLHLNFQFWEIIFVLIP